MFWLYSIGLWIGVLVVIFIVYVYLEHKKVALSVVTIGLIATGIYFQMGMNAGHIIGNEYYASDQPRYMVKVLDDYQVSINMNSDEFDDPDFRTMEYERHGHDLNIVKDDVYFNYKNFVTGVTVRISDGNKKAQVIVKASGEDSSKSPVYTLKK